MKIQELNKDYIQITQASKRVNCFKISSKADLFKNEYLRVQVSDESIIISVPTLDFKGKTLKTYPIQSSAKWRQIGVTDERLILGQFLIDEYDSDEDKLTVYFK